VPYSAELPFVSLIYKPVTRYSTRITEENKETLQLGYRITKNGLQSGVFPSTLPKPYDLIQPNIKAKA